MKKRIVHFKVVVMVLIVVLSSITGCTYMLDKEMLVGTTTNQDNSIISYNPSEYIYIAETVPLPSNLGNVTDVAYSDGKIYFCTNSKIYTDNENTYLNFSSCDIFVMNIDGTELTRLESYTPPVTVDDNTGGFITIQNLVIDNDGKLWIVEGWHLNTFDIPVDFNFDRDDPWDYNTAVISGICIREIDNTGVEHNRIDISNISEQHAYTTINALAVYKNIYETQGMVVFFLLHDYNNGTSVIYAMDTVGNILFRHNVEYNFGLFIQMPDETIAFTNALFSTIDSKTLILQIIDISSGVMNNTIEIPMPDSILNTGTIRVFNTGNEINLLLSDNLGLYGYIFGDKEMVKLLDWVDSNAVVRNIQDLFLLPDGRIAYVDFTIGETVCAELIILTRTLRSALPAKTILTLAGFNFSRREFIIDAVTQFNEINNEYHIEVKDYYDGNTNDDYNNGLLRLNTELTSGNVPDMIYTAELPYVNYVRQGLLADLYPFIDADSKYNRDDFVQGAFRAYEIDGCLYQVFPNFSIQTIVGASSVVGADMGWNVQEFKTVLDTHSNADIPLGGWFTKIEFLTQVINFDVDTYINWEMGTVHFNNPQFIELLELSNRFSDGEQPNNDSVNDNLSLGRQILIYTSITDFNWRQLRETMNIGSFGEETVYKGFPTMNKNGHIISAVGGFAITEQSQNKDAAWAFLQIFLDEKWQTENLRGSTTLSTNQAVFNQQCIDAQNNIFPAYILGNNDGINVSIKPPTQKDIELIIALINSTPAGSAVGVDEALLNIIIDGATDYFKGIVNAEDAARGIQNRVEIYVSERR